MRLLALAVIVLAFTTGPVRADATDRDAQALKYILQPDGAAPGQAAGWKLESSLLQNERITYGFAGPHGERLHVMLAAADSPEKAYASTRTFKMWYSLESGGSAGSPGLASFLAEVTAALERNDDGVSPFHPSRGAGEGRPGAPPSPLLDLLVWLASALLVLAVPGLVLGQVRAVREVLERPGREALLTAAAVGGGMLFRVLAPHALVKVGMVYPLVDAAVSLQTLPRYGAGGPVLYHALFAAFPLSTDTILWAHTAFSCLSLAAIPALVQRATALPLSGALTAVFLAFTPLFVRDAGSESMLVPAVSMLASGTLLLLGPRRAWEKAAAVPLLAFGGMLRPEMAVVSVVAAALAAMHGPGARRRASVLAAAAVALLLVSQVLYVLSAARSEVAMGNLDFGRLTPLKVVLDLWRMDLLVEWRFLPGAIPLLALVGIAVSVRRKEWRVVLPPAVLAVAWLLFYYVDINEESMLRLHVPPAVLLAAVGAYGVAGLAASARSGAARTAVLAGGLALFAATAAFTAGNVFFSTNSQEEDRVFRAAVEQLPDEPVTLFRLGFEDIPTHALSQQDLERAIETRDGFAPVHRLYPEYLLRPPLRNDRVLPISALTDVPLEPGKPAYFHLSTQCYAMRSAGGGEAWGVEQDPYRSIHPACRYMLLRHAVEPVYLERVRNHGEFALPFHWYPDGMEEMTVGLFRLNGPVQVAESRDSFANVAMWYYNRARPALSQGRYDEAEALLAEGERVLADSPAMWRVMAGFYFLAGASRDDPDMLLKAMACWDRIAAVDIHFPSLLSEMGALHMVYARHVGKERLRTEIDQRLARNPDDVVGLYLKAVLDFYGAQDYAAAEGLLRRVLKTVDDDARVYIYLALSAFYSGRQEEAERLVDRAIEAGRGADPDVYYVRSIVVRHKDMDLAVKDIQRYLDMSSANDRFRYEKKQTWLRRELENLRSGKPSPWWTSRTPSEPWNEK